MKNTYIAAIIAIAAVIVVIAAALLLAGGSNDNGSDETFTVSFDTDNGSYVPSQTVKKGAKLAEPTTTKNGYKFLGWYTAATGGEKFDFNTGITSNRTLYAHWSPDSSISYRVDFDTNGGSNNFYQMVSSGSLLTPPGDPTKTGYKFLGWYTATSGGEQYSFSTPVTSGFTLYAHWIKNSDVKTCTVTFNANGGSPSTTNKVSSGEHVSVPTAPVRPGYTFEGWYTAATGGTEFSFNNTITSDITLYARWTAVPSEQTYTVRFVANGGVPDSTQTIKSGEKAAVPAEPTRSGYKFQGWYTAAAGGDEYNFNSAVTGDLTLYAHWASSSPSKICTITYNANGGSPSTTATVNPGEYAPVPTSPTRAGYKFIGWYTAAEGGSRFVFDNPVTSNVTLYAQWAIQTQSYRVTFDANRGTPNTSEVVKSGDCAVAPADPTRAGYKFIGWYTMASGGEKFDFTTPVTASFTLYAHWYSDVYKSYKVTFDANGGYPGHTVTVESGSKVSKPSDPSRLGYEFDGWFTEKSGGSKFNFNTTIKSDLKLYAHWTPTKEKQCTVAIVDSDGYREEYTVDYGDSFTHYVTHFGRDMMRSLGVSYSKNGTYYYAPYDDGKLSLERTSLFWTEIELDNVTKNTTLYCKFV
jgi:uncharacterized repeat protein (TIGR02543 family)